MARKTGSARRYADALFAIAVERGSIDTTAAEIERISAVTENPAAMRVLAGPGQTVRKKREIVDALAGPLSMETSALVAILLARHRGELLPSLARAFADRVRAQQGIELAEVSTAVPLADEDRQAVASWLAGYLGKRVEMHLTVDPEIIGGLTARVGDQLIDASVRGRLETLKRRLQVGV
ncbi:MAG TPA: ATP synthase F1 subunit delta [Rhodothermia bacterium]|nr:ATP synthase F1 subunit delta [Rhodothermia bacterium]